MKLGDKYHFERDVPSYAEPVAANDLREGEVYFSVMFDDEDMTLPTVETLVFTGKKRHEDGSIVCCFQDLDSHRQGIQHGSPEAEGAIFCFQPQIYLNHIFEFDRALDELIRCSLRRERAKREPQP